MNDFSFDALARRAASALNRRSLLGALTGSALAVVIPHLDTIAKDKKNPHHDDGGKDKGSKGGKGDHGDGDNNAKGVKNYAKCRDYWFDYCGVGYGFEPALAQQCSSDFSDCCALHIDGKDAAAINCVHFLDNEVW